MGGNGSTRRSPGGASPNRASGSAHGFLHRDDGMGVAYACAAEISRAFGRIFGPPGRAAVSARRILARIFQQVCGIQSVAQENAASVLKIAKRGFYRPAKT